jgi:hypothetical protein
MAKRRTSGGKGKPGSDANAARKFADGGGDFGVPVDEVRDREYASKNTKRADPGSALPHAGLDADRTAGAGGPASGPGSLSGGDLDPDIVGVGTGGSGVAQSGMAGRPPGPDDSDGSSNEMASGGPAKGEGDRSGIGKIGGPTRVHGTVHSASDDLTSSTGADAATNPAANDDAFAGEVSMGEAAGQDTPPNEKR